EAQQWYAFTPASQPLRSGAKATLTHLAIDGTTLAVSMTSERDVSSISDAVLADPTLRDELIAIPGLDPRTGEQHGTLNAMGFDFQHSTADNLLNAHRGYQIAFHAEQAGRLVAGTFKYYAASIDGRHYLPISGPSLVLASRLQLGNIRPFGQDQVAVPLSKKYFLGGATSIRGWGRYEVSPLAEGLPIGGNSMLAFSEEIRAVVRGNLGAV